MAIAGVVRDVTVRRPRRRLAIVRARVHDDSGEVAAIWFNQEWLATKLAPGHADSPARPPPARRLPGARVRPRRRAVHGGLRARLPGGRGDDAAAPAGARRPGAARDARACPIRCPPTSGPRLELPLKGDALHALHRPRSLDEAEAARRRLALEELLVLQVGLARRRREREDDVARALQPPGELAGALRDVLPFELTKAQERVIGELDADLQRAVPMERLLQGDVGSGKTVVARLRAVARGRGRVPRRADGADGDACRTALPHRGVALHAARRHVRPVDELGGQARPRASCAGGRRRRHARAHPGGRRPRRPRRRRRRRAASLRRRAAQGALGGHEAAHAAHDGNADSADACADRLRRPGRLRDRRAARRPPADRHELGDGRAQLGGLPAPTPTPRGRQAGIRRVPARLRVRRHRGAGGGAGGRAAAACRAARAAGRLHARPAAAGRAARADGALQGGRAGRARRDDGDRGRRRRARTRRS